MTPLPPILSLKDAYLRFGDKVILKDATLSILPRDRICLVGRNGCGKSTLLEVLIGQLELDQGKRFVQPGVRLSLLEQSILGQADVSALDYLQQNQSLDVQPHESERMLEALKISPKKSLLALSGGEGRRIALAKALVSQPELLLLDEPTNHLDMPTIQWLEEEMRTYRGALLMISHDRTFLSNLSKRTFWLDRGHLRTLEKGYDSFDAWADKILEIEASEQGRLEQKIAQEMVWLHKGVTARRKRNMGRLKHLRELRRERAQRSGPQGSIRFAEAGETSTSKRVIEAFSISKFFTSEAGKERQIIKSFSTRIQRGDRVGIVGPNGSGKTTLIKMLTGELSPDQGRVKRAKTLEVARFEQDQSSMLPDDTPCQYLCPQGGDQVMVQGTPRHVIGYLKDFLFDAKQARSPLKSLSGGERNRLLLANILAKPSNLLVLDEPTNDLDMDSLDLLQEYIDEYPGTLLIVSHDRDFLDRTTSSLIVLEGEGDVQEYVGGYSDYVRARKPTGEVKHETVPEEKTQREKPKSSAKKLTYKDARDRAILPQEIEQLHREIHRLEDALMDPDLYKANPDQFHQLTDAVKAAKASLEEKEERWLEIEMKAEDLKQD